MNTGHSETIANRGSHGVTTQMTIKKGWITPGRAPYLFVAPYLILTCIFFLYPLFDAILLAFYQTNGPLSRVYVGGNNFRFVLTDPDFHKAVINTSIFAFFSIVLQLPLALLLAMMLNTCGNWTKGMFRLMIFAPALVGQAFVGIIFNVMFIPQYGTFNRLLFELTGWGLQMNWLQNSHLVMPALVIAAVWMSTGFNMVYFLAALQSVDKSLIDAATVDGANSWQRFRNVTLPSIKPIATFVLVMSTIGSYQLFELVYVLLNRGYGPDNAGLTIVAYLYRAAFERGDLGRGASVGWILVVIIFCLSLFQLRLSGSLKEE